MQRNFVYRVEKRLLWLPHEGTNDIALAMISFPSLAEYEAYRARLRDDDRGARNFHMAQEKRFILSEERTFLEPVVLGDAS